ncbi:hypothetical protein [Streptomyces chryseus]|uniref:hypothetical protein n=1 Tax=Streptomyces chryseus TaxID=68186 RepID=UPI0019B23855|nr:hypothetical protein GCM10010353_73000 [Streptomyces chryseus]
MAGYTGSNVVQRGRDVETEACWSVPQLQELLDEWITGGFTDPRSSDTGSELRRFIDYMYVTVPHALLVSPDGMVLDFVG